MRSFNDVIKKQSEENELCAPRCQAKRAGFWRGEPKYRVNLPPIMLKLFAT
jgi:hypothetical protein